jgi:hypothetical protein
MSNAFVWIDCFPFSNGEIIRKPPNQIKVIPFGMKKGVASHSYLDHTNGISKRYDQGNEMVTGAAKSYQAYPTPA